METNLNVADNYFEFLPKELHSHIVTFVNDVDSLRKVSTGCRDDWE